MTMTRRRLLAAAPLGTLLAACGGGGSGEGTDAPAIQEFALAAPAQVGERASLRVRYSGGSGRIEPGLGAVNSGRVVETPVLGAAQRYRLIVSAPGVGETVRELRVEPGWRNRLRGFEAPPMAGHAVAAAADGSALVLGGSRGEGVLSSAIDRFDPATQRFTRLGSMASGRSDMSAVPLGDGRVLVFGGSTSSVQPPFAEIVDTRTGAASSGGWMVLPRSRHAALRLADGRVAAVGGVQRNGIELWNPGSNTWAPAGNRMAHTREHATASLLPGGRVLIVGGYTPAAQYRFAEVFDPAAETFTPVADAPAERRWLHAALTLADGSVLIIGGENDDGALASVWRFDVDAQRFVAQPALTTARSVVRAVVTPDDEVLLYGGEQQPDEGLSSGVAWRAGSQRALPELSAPRAWHSVTRLADGRLLVLGGQHRGEFVGGGMLYD
jgi:Galactose oxidase, central domain